ncbi:hypothetical protein AAMO2058_001158900 [Amorphochlora amoebiformis]
MTPSLRVSLFLNFALALALMAAVFLSNNGHDVVLRKAPITRGGVQSGFRQLSVAAQKPATHFKTSSKTSNTFEYGCSGITCGKKTKCVHPDRPVSKACADCPRRK